MTRRPVSSVETARKPGKRQARSTSGATRSDLSSWIGVNGFASGLPSSSGLPPIEVAIMPLRNVSARSGKSARIGKNAAPRIAEIKESQAFGKFVEELRGSARFRLPTTRLVLFKRDRLPRQFRGAGEHEITVADQERRPFVNVKIAFEERANGKAEFGFGQALDLGGKLDFFLNVERGDVRPIDQAPQRSFELFPLANLDQNDDVLGFEPIGIVPVGFNIIGRQGRPKPREDVLAKSNAARGAGRHAGHRPICLDDWMNFKNAVEKRGRIERGDAKAASAPGIGGSSALRNDG